MFVCLLLLFLSVWSRQVKKSGDNEVGGSSDKSGDKNSVMVHVYLFMHTLMQQAYAENLLCVMCPVMRVEK